MFANLKGAIKGLYYFNSINSIYQIYHKTQSAIRISKKPTLFHHLGVIKSAFCLCNYSSSKSRKRRSNSFVESCSIFSSICFLRYAASASIATRISKSVSLSLRTIRYFFIVITSVRSSEYSITDIGKIINLANQAND